MGRMDYCDITLSLKKKVKITKFTNHCTYASRFSFTPCAIICDFALNADLDNLQLNGPKRQLVSNDFVKAFLYKLSDIVPELKSS